MAQAPTHASTTTTPAKPAEPAKPATPPPAAEPPKDPAKPPEPDPDAGTQPVEPDQAESLLRNGHRLKKKGAPKGEWFALQRLDKTWCKVTPITEDDIKKLIEEKLVLEPSF